MKEFYRNACCGKLHGAVLHRNGPTIQLLPPVASLPHSGSGHRRKEGLIIMRRGD
jgi:hypothetical protein